MGSHYIRPNCGIRDSLIPKSKENVWLRGQFIEYRRKSD